MNLFNGDKLDPHAFDEALRRGTHDLSDVLFGAAQTQSAQIESTHFLMALATVQGGVTQKYLNRFGLTSEDWQKGLRSCAQSSPGALPPTQLIRANLHPSATAMLEMVEEQMRRESGHFSRVPETILLLSALHHVTGAVREVIIDPAVGIDLEMWCRELEDSLKPVEPLVVFVPGDSETIKLGSFSPGGLKILEIMKNEAESLGFSKADPRHLLLALLAFEGGATQYGIYHQGLAPRKIHETVMLNLRGHAKRVRSTLTLGPSHMQPLLQRILTLAGEIAGRGHVEFIAEPHLLQAFLFVETSAQRVFKDEKVNLVSLREMAEGFEIAEEKPTADSTVNLDTVRERLQQRIVGQDEAIERVLNYVERMQFGFTTPGRPVGTFLFCGQSGSGKTEMAKELARAIYGSEENLIFLEMGQFNSPESMNIFVGAPPGYVGYGEGKLTNGLRDKPRSVVLFDEVEKAHSKVLDALLRFLDEGRIDDPAGPVRDGSQCMLILTSNVGAEQLSQLWNTLANNINWRTIVRQRLREEFRRANFRVEFLNRVDELILFRTLKAEDYANIASRLLERDLSRLRDERQINVSVDEDVNRIIGLYCEKIGEGARAAQRLTQSVVITPVINFFVRKKCKPPVRFRVRVNSSTNDLDSEPSGEVTIL